MAGKSTLLRQTALITIMAQMGSYVPCHFYDCHITDRIFTRIGAGDDLASGQSTFMIEMNEAANILNNATSDSLLILDEIGRGTSTRDGFAIALAIIEFISENIKAKTLFATHFHDLHVSEGRIAGVKNYSFSAQLREEGLEFLHKLQKGAADNSFGIHVAKMAGLPVSVIMRSMEIQEFMEKAPEKARSASIRGDGAVEYNKKRRSSTRLNIEDLDQELTPTMLLERMLDMDLIAGRRR